MIIRIDSNFNIIDKIDEPDDKLIIATEIGVKKLKFYYVNDSADYVVNISFKRADNMVIGGFNVALVEDENGIKYREFILDIEELTAIAGALQITIRYEKYFDNELIFSRPINMVVAIYEAVATGNDTLSFLIEELEQIKRELEDIKESDVAGDVIYIKQDNSIIKAPLYIKEK